MADIEMAGTSPMTKNTMEQTIERSLDVMDDKMDSRADPDAQTTVTDFLDFTEYLPSDMVRSLTLIGKLDETYTHASSSVDDLTRTWGQLPKMAVEDRPAPAQLRADISEQLNRAVSSRVFAHAEAVRMSENVHKHYNKAKVLLSKLQTMMDNYPTDVRRSPVASKSPQMVRSKLTVRPTGEGGQKIRNKRVPKITVPGEVLAPYDIEYDMFSDDSDVSSDDDSEGPAVVRKTPSTAPRIKLVTHKTPKSASRPRPVIITDAAMAAAAAANAAALLNPPPENAVIGGPDAPWLQLTPYELAKLRKRMKKNATWAPSETMIARELKALNRGPDSYREAKKAAEAEGKVFDPKIPAPVVDEQSGAPQLPTGAISVDSLAHDSNRGMKLNEAKKLKREAMAKAAAEEAGETWIPPVKNTNKGLLAPPSHLASQTSVTNKPKVNTRSPHKRKRSDGGEEEGTVPEAVETPSRPQMKRNKTETPVPPPQRLNTRSAPEGSQSASQTTPATTSSTQSRTPVPIPKPPTKNATSPSPGSASSTVTTSVPVKAPAQTPVPLPPSVASLGTPSTTSTDGNRRQTRGEAAKQGQHPPNPPAVTDLPVRRSSSRSATPRTDPGAERRPGSRGGKATSQEPQPNHAMDRPRRSSTARNTPAPDVKPPVKRSKRPPPGVVSTSSSGGNSAIGKRKEKPKQKLRTTKKGKDQPAETVMEVVDDEGNPIDPNEPRYCICNDVSYGDMIACENSDCKHEWFHLGCVGLKSAPARTTKWYCPECRVLLGLGVKGEVSARGVKK